MINYDYFQSQSSMVLKSLSLFKTYNELIEGEDNDENNEEFNDINREEDK